jgi:hypothetical protein
MSLSGLEHSVFQPSCWCNAISTWSEFSNFHIKRMSPKTKWNWKLRATSGNKTQFWSDELYRGRWQALQKYVKWYFVIKSSQNEKKNPNKIIQQRRPTKQICRTKSKLKNIPIFHKLSFEKRAPPKYEKS